MHYHLVRKMIFSVKVYVTLLDYLKIPQVTCMFKEFLLLLPDSCVTPLPTKLHVLTHPLSLLANQEIL
jgi:hypothetical protein